MAEFGQIIISPISGEVINPPDEIFRCFPRWQADHTFGIFTNPFQKSQGCKKSQFGKIINENIGNLGSWIRSLGFLEKILFDW